MRHLGMPLGMPLGRGLIWGRSGEAVVPAVQYLLRDEFTTDATAPLASPRTCEPGSGKLVITDAGNRLSIADGKLVKTSGTAFKLLSEDSFQRQTGLAFYARGTENGGIGEFGFSSDGIKVADGAVLRNTLAQAIDNTNTTVSNLAGGYYQIANLRYDLLVVQRSVGSFALIRGGNIGKWRLLWPGKTTNGVSNKLIYKPNNATDTGNMDDFSVVQLGGVFASDNGIASFYTPLPVSPVSCTCTRAAVMEITWTPAAGETLELYFRQVDANNRMIIRCNQGGSTVASFRVTSGVETQIQSAAQIWTVGTPYRIVLSTNEWGGLGLLVNSALKLNTSNLTHEYGTGYGAAGFATAIDFGVYPAVITPLPAPFDYSGFRWLSIIGDSKTVPSGAASYIGHLIDTLETATGSRWCFEPIAHSGMTVAGMAAGIATDLALQTETPEIVLINLGTNDAGGAVVEATWKNDYRTIIASVHTKWPTAKIYLAKPMRLTANPPSVPVAMVATLHSYIDALVSEYDYVYAGIDETSLEGGDSYATNFADYLHPNALGYAQTAVLWKAVMGY
jgi:hypothetical protein